MTSDAEFPPASVASKFRSHKPLVSKVGSKVPRTAFDTLVVPEAILRHCCCRAGEISSCQRWSWASLMEPMTLTGAVISASASGAVRATMGRVVSLGSMTVTERDSKRALPALSVTRMSMSNGAVVMKPKSRLARINRIDIYRLAIYNSDDDQKFWR